ncbi:MAG: ribonuclease HI family protein [Nitrospirota bacterium]
MAKELIMYTDGASRNNPGEAGAGVHIMENNKPVIQLARYLGKTTNNIAEYSAAIMGLEYAVQHVATRVTLLADSELLVKQLNGQYKVKNEGLKPLYLQAKKLMAHIGSVEVQYIPREMNREADALANKAIDEKVNPKIQISNNK